MTREHQEFLKSKGWYSNEELLAFSKLTFQEIEERQDNIRAYDFIRLDSLFEEGKIDFENPPNIWGMTFQRWILKKFGLKVLVDYLKNYDLKDKLSVIPGRLKAIGVSENDIEAALNPVTRIDKSKVVILGNKLSKTMTRKDAFIKAWAIVKAGSIEITVNGVTFGNRQEALKRLAKYEPSQIKAVLVPEPENQFDHNAIAVMVGVQNGKGLYRLGYVPRSFTGTIRAINTRKLSLKVLGGDIHGARLSIAV